jgi:hypothetical protein
MNGKFPGFKHPSEAHPAHMAHRIRKRLIEIRSYDAA